MLFQTYGGFRFLLREREVVTIARHHTEEARRNQEIHFPKVPGVGVGEVSREALETRETSQHNGCCYD